MNKTKILKLLLTRRAFTIKKIAEALKINYRTAYETAIQLEKDGLIKVTKVGNAKLCEISNKFNQELFHAEYERKQDLFKNKDFLVIHNKLAELEFPFIALLFGSEASGKATKHSDIDILAIGDQEKEIKATLSLWPVHLTLVSYSDFIHMAKSREFTVVSEAIKNNIILIGIEEYYRLLNNAGYT